MQTGGMGSNEDGARLMHIGAVAERTELSFRTLRHYDEIGLVNPSERSEGGFRLYSEADVERILLIRRMKPLDFTLEQMRELLDITHDVAQPNAPAEARQKLQEIEAIATERRTVLERKVAMADEFLARLRRLSAGEPQSESEGPES